MLIFPHHFFLFHVHSGLKKIDDEKKVQLSPLPVQEPDVQIEAQDEVRRARRQVRVQKELDGLLEDNAGKLERDKNIIWRKIQRFVAKNDGITNEYGYLSLFYCTNSPQGVTMSSHVHDIQYYKKYKMVVYMRTYLSHPTVERPTNVYKY